MSRYGLLHGMSPGRDLPLPPLLPSRFLSISSTPAMCVVVASQVLGDPMATNITEAAAPSAAELKAAQEEAARETRSVAKAARMQAAQERKMEKFKAIQAKANAKRAAEEHALAAAAKAKRVAAAADVHSMHPLQAGGPVQTKSYLT